MEAIGDSPLVDDLEAVKADEKQKKSVEFERNLEDFGKVLEEEENRLMKLEEKRLKLMKEIEELSEDIKEEKARYRKAIDDVIDEREKISRDYIDNLTADLSPIQSSVSLFEACAEALEATKKIDFNIELDIEAIRCDLLENFISTKEDYLNTIKDHFL